ncbi:MAG: ABC transporter substrate-binding protein [Galactobacter sp.]
MTRTARTNSIKRFTTVATAVALSGLMLAGCQGKGTSESGDALTVGLTYTPNVQFAPFYVAEDLGYFDDEGVDVDLRHHGQNEDLFGAMKSGKEQLVYASGDEITQAAAGGTDVVSVATLYNTYPAVLITKADSGIEKPEDLKGKTVGVPGLYGQTYLALLAMLDDAGLSQEDVDLQAVGYTQQAALSSDRVDAVMGFSNNEAVQFEADGLKIRTIEAVDAKKPQLVGPSVGADSKTIKDNSKDVTKVLSAVDKAIDYMEENPEETVDIAAKYVPSIKTDEQKQQALATLKATLPLMAADGDAPLLTNNSEKWSTMATFMEKAGIIDEAVDPTSLYTNDLLP